MEALNDWKRIFYEFVTVTGTDFYSKVGTRVWEKKPPSSFVNTQAAIVFHSETSQPEPIRGGLRTIVVVKCYGGDGEPDSPGDVNRRLFKRLDLASGTVASGQLILAKCLDMMDLPNDPDHGWPVEGSRYEIITK